MKKVLTYGTYDILRKENIDFLESAKNLGDYLVVGISTDEYNQEMDIETEYNYKGRKEVLKAIKYVDKVIPFYDQNQVIDDININKIDILALEENNKILLNIPEDNCEIIYINKPNKKVLKRSLNRDSNL